MVSGDITKFKKTYQHRYFRPMAKKAFDYAMPDVAEVTWTTLPN